MRILKSISQLLPVVVAIILFTPTNAFLRHLCFNPLGLGRIDPLVSPESPAEHVHHLHGARNLGFNSTDPDYLLESNCTSCSITVDKSNYWTPAMYFQHANGSFSSLTTASAITIYYKLEKRANFEHHNYTVFPKGFRMIAGTNAKRSWVGSWPVGPQSDWGLNDTTQAALAEKAIGFNCLNYRGAAAEPSMAYPYIRDKAFLDRHCLDGVRAEILFPSCWDGVNLDSADHKSHVAYPTLIQDGACPVSHPIFLPILFFETIWNTQEFLGLPGQYVLANGDPTGYGYHADFIAAWEDDILQKIMDDPTCTDHDLDNRHTNGIQEECLAIRDSIQTPDKAAECKLQTPDILVDEQVTGLLSFLPNNVSVRGVRHDPGDRSVIPSSEFSISSSPQTTLATKTGASIAPSGISTSVFTEGNVLYEVIVVETVVTVTVAATTASALVPRHRHGHGHRLL